MLFASLARRLSAAHDSLVLVLRPLVYLGLIGLVLVLFYACVPWR